MFEKIKARHREKHPLEGYALEEQKLKAYLAKIDPGTEEYSKAQAQLKENCTLRQVNWESKHKITFGDRAKIFLKLLGGGITLGGVFMLGKYEADGNMLTGEKKKFGDAFVKVLGNFFGGGN